VIPVRVDCQELPAVNVETDLRDGCTATVAVLMLCGAYVIRAHGVTSPDAVDMYDLLIIC